jgi:hypothetical protein
MKHGTYTYGMTPPEVLTKAMAEELGDKPYTMELPATSEDCNVVMEAVNQGIDAHLEAITDSKFTWVGSRLHCQVAHKDMLVLLRRLGEMDSDDAMSLRSSILSTLEIEEI